MNLSSEKKEKTRRNILLVAASVFLLVLLIFAVNQSMKLNRLLSDNSRFQKDLEEKEGRLAEVESGSVVLQDLYFELRSEVEVFYDSVVALKENSRQLDSLLDAKFEVFEKKMDQKLAKIKSDQEKANKVMYGKMFTIQETQGNLQQEVSGIKIKDSIPKTEKDESSSKANADDNSEKSRVRLGQRFGR